MKLVIDRSKWVCGTEDPEILDILDNTMLLNPDSNRKCCLGHYLTLIGIKDSHISDRATPQDIFCSFLNGPETSDEETDTYGRKLKGLVYKKKDTAWTDKAVILNDGEMEQKEREEKLVKHFAKIGVELSFKGKLW